MNILSDSPDKTKQIGEELGRCLKKNDVVALFGELGSGKTCFTQGLMKGLGVKDSKVTSPSFVLINEYSGRLPVYHFDIYRLNNTREVIDLGYEEYFYGDGVTIIEWADKIEELLPKDCIRVYLKIVGENEREIDVQGATLNILSYDPRDRHSNEDRGSGSC